jgi:UDP-N-acetyl-2-amino-2-deoxyglucuronate dehydrogenase
MDTTERDALNSSEPVGVAVIGAGAIAQAHLYSFQQARERARLVAVCDSDEARAKVAAERFGVGLVLRNYEDVLARNDVQAVSICTPPFTHVEMTTAALRAGKHVLCEKPVSATLAGLDAIAEEERASGRVFAAVFQLRFGRGAQQVRLLLDEGRFGRLHLGLAETLWFRDHPYYAVDWRGTWAQECGGVTSSLAVHLIDCLLWFMGEPESVFAEADTFRARIEQDDTSVAVVRFSDGGVGQITSTVSSFGEERSRLELYGTELMAISRGPVYDATSDFLLSGPDASRVAALRQELDERIPPGYAILHQGAVADFLEAIREGRPPLAGVDACRAALQLTTAIYKSAMTGQRVELPIGRDEPFYHHLPPKGFALPSHRG